MLLADARAWLNDKKGSMCSYYSYTNAITETTVLGLVVYACVCACVYTFTYYVYVYLLHGKCLGGVSRRFDQKMLWHNRLAIQNPYSAKRLGRAFRGVSGLAELPNIDILTYYYTNIPCVYEHNSGWLCRAHPCDYILHISVLHNWQRRCAAVSGLIYTFLILVY